MLTILIPKNVNIKIGESWIHVMGPLGEKIKSKPNSIVLYRKNNKLCCLNKTSAQVLLYLNYISEIFVGVSKGYYTKLKLVGVGFKVEIHDNKLLEFRLGYSHSIYYKIPEDLNIEIPKNKSSVLIIYGIDLQKVKQTAAEIRFLKKPESYKGKGIRYFDETIKLKEGKKSNV